MEREQIKKLFCEWCILADSCKDITEEKKLDCCNATGFVNEFESLGYRRPAELSPGVELHRIEAQLDSIVEAVRQGDSVDTFVRAQDILGKLQQRRPAELKLISDDVMNLVWIGNKSLSERMKAIAQAQLTADQQQGKE